MARSAYDRDQESDRTESDSFQAFPLPPTGVSSEPALFGADGTVHLDEMENLRLQNCYLSEITSWATSSPHMP